MADNGENTEQNVSSSENEPEANEAAQSAPESTGDEAPATGEAEQPVEGEEGREEPAPPSDTQAPVSTAPEPAAEKPKTPGTASAGGRRESRDGTDSASGKRSNTGSNTGSRHQSALAKQSPSTSARRTSVRQSAVSRPESGFKTPGMQHSDGNIAESPLPPHRPKIPSELPEGVMPLFLATQTQQIFACVADNHVTEENPFKLLKKEDVINDMFNRGAVSDFSPIKKIINEYPGSEILIGFDRDFKFGNNFIIATTEDAKEKLLRAPTPAEEEETKAKTPVPKVIYRYIPPVSKPWVSQGSEAEILEETVTDNRPRIRMQVKRMRKQFGAPCTFSDRNVSQAKDGYIECLAVEDKSFNLQRLELAKGTQAIPNVCDQPAQTDWKFPRNNTTQYSPREFDEMTRNQIGESKSMQTFAKTVTAYFEVLLQQNEITDIMVDDYKNLGEEDDGFGSKSDTHLKEYQSFTDLQFSKEKTITCIDWHPTIKGIVAVSIGEKLSFDQRIDDLAKVIMTPSLILVWSFADPINPQLLLEAPDDILCFKFMPTNPAIVAGGCINGQVVLWDISEHLERLKAPRAGKKKASSIFTGLDDSAASDTPVVRYCAVSSIENSHRAPISDIQWLPDHFEVTKTGIAQENKTGQCVQLLTASIDHNVIFWDMRAPKTVQQQQQMQNADGKINQFKFLDLNWKPHLKVTLYKSEPGGDHSPLKFCIAERQGDRSILQEPDDEFKSDGTKKDASGLGSFQFGKKSDSEKKALKRLNTHMYVGTEDGELVYVDWMPQKDQDTGKLQTPKPDFYQTVHDGPIQTIQRSPFFKDVLLCVGGWNFTLWKEGVNSGPILNPAANSKRLTGGHWSPTRPSIFYITRADGTIDIWDLLDRTHEPSLHQNVTPAPITTIFIQQVNSKQQLLGIGDDTGTLHILEVPWSLRQAVPNEMQSMSNYLEREVKRRHFVMARWDFREQEKMELEMEAKRKAGIAPNVVLTDEEIEFRMKQEYQAYLDEEQNFLRALGLKEEPLEPLPADK